MILAKEQGLGRLYLKSCLRCGGDMTTEKDYYGAYKTCLQCGHVVDLDEAGLQEILTRSA